MPYPSSTRLRLRIEKSGSEYRIQEDGGGATSFLTAEEILPLFREAASRMHSKPFPPQEAKALGKQLFSTLLQYGTLERFWSAREAARSTGQALRLWLNLDRAEELDDLPWELLTDPGAGDFFSLVRNVPSPEPPRKPLLAGPLRILAVLSCPADLPPFDTSREWESLQRALQGLVEGDRVSIERLKEPSEAGLRSALAQRPFQVLHFVGYGHSNPRVRHGSLFLEGQARHSRALTAEYLAGLLGRHPTASLMVLDMGGNTGETNPFAETARVLVRNGLGAVVAMRRRLSGESAVAFHRELYSSLASYRSIEQSVMNARCALAQRCLEAEWDAPMLYASVGDETPLEPVRALRDLPRADRPLASPSQPDQRQTAAEIAAILQRKSAGQSEDRRGLKPGSGRKIKILILAASPENMTRLRLDAEMREIGAGLRRARYRGRFQIEHSLAVRPLDLQQALLDVEPQIVHFCGHGGGLEGLILEDNDGRARPVPTSALAKLFGLFSDRIECVVLNSCHSEHQAKAIAQHVPYVVGMKTGIGDRAAINFATGFYCALGAGHPIDFAYLMGRSAIELESLPDHLTPVLLAGSPA